VNNQVSAMSLRQVLQRETSDLHRMLDELAEQRGFFKSRVSYGAWLHATTAFHREVARALQAGGFGDMVDDDRVVLLLEDLGDLGLVPGPAPIGGRLEIGSSADLLGVTYVVEGAALGSRVLYKRAQALGLSAAFGARFLAAEAADLEAWRETVARLDEADLAETDRMRAIRAGRMAFEFARECLDGRRCT
jgi:heme oxygenase